LRTLVHDIWGCARGPVAALAPPTRIAAGAAILAASMVAPAANAPGAIFIFIITAVWLALCGLPLKLVRSLVVYGLILLLPIFLIAHLSAALSEERLEGWDQWMAAPWSILVRGISAVLVSVATFAVLSPGDFREGLIRLPLPGIVTEILAQIVQQTATLYYETRRVAAAMAVRGASNAGLTAWRMVVSLPRVWLPRVMQRAERVAAALELRGYCDGELRSLQPRPPRFFDYAALVLVSCTLVIAAAIRWWSAV
jgi:energy-coupling factor transporter transmembrane protein EcfT